MTVMDFVTDEIFSVPLEKTIAYLQDLKRISKNAYILLENLLNWARNQQKLIKYKPSIFNLKYIVQESISVLNGIAGSKSISLIFDIDETLTAYFDKETVSTVIRNLISNSLKFTNTNGEIRVTVINFDIFLQISVKDSGVGMSPEVAHKLFKLDQIFSTFGTNREKGTGLGLILCKDFVEGNGGKIWVESELGKGSDFKFTLPKFQPGN